MSLYVIAVSFVSHKITLLCIGSSQGDCNFYPRGLSGNGHCTDRTHCHREADSHHNSHAHCQHPPHGHPDDLCTHCSRDPHTRLLCAAVHALRPSFLGAISRATAADQSDHQHEHCRSNRLCALRLPPSHGCSDTSRLRDDQHSCCAKWRLYFTDSVCRDEYCYSASCYLCCFSAAY